ncbi:hypothetical protein BG004_001674 [Podila humilis]|nr:hypothetical protein BG004_001674 [Podila humilis]
MKMTDYTVNSERMLLYFENLVLLQHAGKFTVPDIGYDCVISLRPVGWKMPNPKRQRATKQAKDIEEWIFKEQILQPLNPDDVDATITLLEKLQHEEEREAAAVEEKGVHVGLAKWMTCSRAVEDEPVNNSIR